MSPGGQQITGKINLKLGFVFYLKKHFISAGSWHLLRESKKAKLQWLQKLMRQFPDNTSTLL